MGVKLNREWRSKGAQQCRLLALSGQSSRTRVCPLLDQSRQISLILLVLLITAANIDKVLQSSAREESLREFCSSHWALGLAGLLGGPNADTATLLPRLSLLAKASATQKWSSW